ncbi:GntR family transcriptional regulator, regulator for abcA and norABC [Alteribacillus persepolensis]|uniref:GntR family transcriptional regulator, regulator for abcA and norABC n=1 Tax=Alteribacillus persepolensis TaxID=568899 RepID=A0A1G8ED21_9BACI|nr:PLP-dependent aminotransferase family protein [Alteribacillus persepolensis]SDH67758.1 GntR family transcriptional regulator, regulator for abcA and norABC [Alteribacillus persepolensis]
MTEKWIPNPDSHIPYYLQIKQYILDKIKSGEWHVGFKLPSQRKLAEDFGVNRSTVINAYDEAAADGYIDSYQGRGTIVVDDSPESEETVHPPDWHAYAKSGKHHPNTAVVQSINREEFNTEMIRLGTGELSPQLLPVQQMNALFQHISIDDKQLGYEEPKGSLLLREQISERVLTLGISASPGDILITSGALQGLQLVASGLLQKQSTVLVEKPSYLYSLQLLQSENIQMAGLPLYPENYETEIEKARKKHNPALMYTIPSFHNPTGRCMTVSQREELLHACRKYSLPIIEDDVYHDLWLDTPPPPALKSMDTHGLVLYMGSLSKSLSPGLRIGWVIGPEEVIDRLADIKMQTDYGSSSLSQKIVYHWLKSGRYEEYVEQIREHLRKRRDFMLKLLHEYFQDIAAWNTPKGSFYIWIQFHSEVSVNRLYYKALQKNILLNPGTIYDKTAAQSLRLSFAYASYEEMEYGIKTLRELISIK